MGVALFSLPANQSWWQWPGEQLCHGGIRNPRGRSLSEAYPATWMTKGSVLHSSWQEQMSWTGRLLWCKALALVWPPLHVEGAIFSFVFQTEHLRLSTVWTFFCFRMLFLYSTLTSVTNSIFLCKRNSIGANLRIFFFSKSKFSRNDRFFGGLFWIHFLVLFL